MYIISGKPQQSWVDSSTSTPPSIHKTSEKWTKSMSLTNRILLVFVHFSDVLWMDGGVGVEESTQDCCERQATTRTRQSSPRSSSIRLYLKWGSSKPDSCRDLILTFSNSILVPTLTTRGVCVNVKSYI